MGILGLDAHFYKYALPLALTESVFFAYALASDLRTRQVVLGLVGLWWCLAALWVEVKIEHAYPGFDYEKPTDPEMKAYRPFCDFAPWATCSKVLMSPPGRFLRYFGIAKSSPEGGLFNWARHMIDVPNPTLGVLFFGCHLFYPALLWPSVPMVGYPDFVPPAFFLACCFVGLMTIWLAYNLAFVLKDFCIVCVSMYVANFTLIPMMLGLCQEQGGCVSTSWLAVPPADPLAGFFGSAPPLLVGLFGLMDAVMLVVVLKLYLGGPSHGKAQEVAAGAYSEL